MRKALNENPVVQAASVGVLAIVVAFLLLTRVAGQGGGSESPPATESGAVTPSAGATAPTPAPGAATAPSPAAEAAPSGTAPSPAVGGSTGFEAGPGLPREVVDAHEDGEVVVLLVTRYRAIDDRKLEAQVNRLRGRSDVAVFSTLAFDVARYSRITQGVDVDRTPALVVVEPKRLAEGPLPAATVSYGFRGAPSVDQAVRDALYEGRNNLPYYPR
jgi:hypothetical protein